MRYKTIARRLMLGAAAGAFAATAACAQAEGVETIVVTAQKRVQDVQAVPVTVDAFSGDQLRQSNINTVNDLASAYQRTASGPMEISTGLIAGNGKIGRISIGESPAGAIYPRSWCRVSARRALAMAPYHCHCLRA